MDIMGLAEAVFGSLILALAFIVSRSMLFSLTKSRRISKDKNDKE